MCKKERRELPGSGRGGGSDRPAEFPGKDSVCELSFTMGVGFGDAIVFESLLLLLVTSPVLWSFDETVPSRRWHLKS